MATINLYKRKDNSVEPPTDLKEYELGSSFDIDTTEHNAIIQQLSQEQKLQPGDMFRLGDQYVWFAGVSDSGEIQTKTYYRCSNS